MSSEMNSLHQQVSKKTLKDINIITVVTSGNPSQDCQGIIFEHRKNMSHLGEKNNFKSNLEISQLNVFMEQSVKLAKDACHPENMIKFSNV